MKAVIFDFDGTLANTLPICFQAFQQVFREFDDKELTADEIKSMFGPSETGIIRKNLLIPQKEQAIELYYQSYKKKHSEFVQPNKEIDALITYLKKEGYKLGIVTGKARRSLDISLDALQMEDLFEVIITGDDVLDPKPHPEGIEKALSLLGVHPTDALFIGDSDADIEAGRRANVQTIGVQWLPDYQTIKFGVKPDHSLNKVEELIELLKTGVPNEL
ncbi:HAD family hydrolase [Falsibacillus albus]|uniref:HAD family hydrolase n=1 Tax=Falsibacillus albus TaxID=2478915 RepID=A0A3L7K2X4_9BACI|nr:HAD family hydrolase [Falsibacillus albus]RLQ97457.1 HAD family hydrolase [Falsibacillus albus]